MADLELTRFLLAIVLLLSATLALGQAFTLLNLPRVIGEICAGLILGPSLVGHAFPEVYAWIFKGFPEQEKLLSAFYWFGLILLMFTAGFKIPFDLNKSDRSRILMLVAGGLFLPLIFGFLLSSLLPNQATPSPLAFALVIAIASSVTSIPVITRIFIELDLQSTRFAQLVLSAAAVQDLFLWVLLSIALSLNAGKTLEFSSIGPVVASTLVFAFLSITLMPSVVRHAGRALAK